MLRFARRSVAGLAAVGLLVACGELAEPPPELDDPEARSLRATDLAASDGPAAPAADDPREAPQDDTSDVEPAASSDGEVPDTTEQPETAGSDGDDAAPAADRPPVHPDRYLTRWLQHHLPRASQEEWPVEDPGSYDPDLASLARIVEAAPEVVADLDQVRAEILAVDEPGAPLSVDYLGMEFDGGYDGLLWIVTASVDGEAVRLLDQAGSVAGYLESSYRTDIVDVDTIDDVHVFHLTQGPGGVETRVWRQGPHTVYLTGPIGIGLDAIAAATIAANR